VTRCLGKLAPRHDARTFKLCALLGPSLPAPPPSVDWTKPLPADLGEMANDRLGDCTCAGAAHLVQTWTGNRGDMLTIADDAIVAAYSAVAGYTPNDPTTDNGAALLDVLNFWRQTGIGGHQIGAFAAVDHANVVEVKQACDLFGGLYTGVQLPQSAMDATDNGAAWSDVDDTNILGGHCVALVGYDADGVTYVTWGKRQRATWAWVERYADEMYALIAADWVSGAAEAPSGFDLAQLQADLGALR
jgi:hypothetical protein